MKKKKKKKKKKDFLKYAENQNAMDRHLAKKGRREGVEGGEKWPRRRGEEVKQETETRQSTAQQNIIHWMTQMTSIDLN